MALHTKFFCLIFCPCENCKLQIPLPQYWPWLVWAEVFGWDPNLSTLEASTTSPPHSFKTLFPDYFNSISTNFHISIKQFQKFPVLSTKNIDPCCSVSFSLPDGQGRYFPGKSFSPTEFFLPPHCPPPFGFKKSICVQETPPCLNSFFCTESRARNGRWTLSNRRFHLESVEGPSGGGSMERGPPRTPKDTPPFGPHFFLTQASLRGCPHRGQCPRAACGAYPGVE